MEQSLRPGFRDCIECSELNEFLFIGVVPFLQTKLYCRAVEQSPSLPLCCSALRFPPSSATFQGKLYRCCTVCCFFFLGGILGLMLLKTLKHSKGTGISWIVLLGGNGGFWALSSAFSQREKWINLMKVVLNFLLVFSIRNLRGQAYFVPFGILVEHMEALCKTCGILCFLLV